MLAGRRAGPRSRRDCRSSTYVEVGLQVAARDLHSGLFGGSAQNAAQRPRPHPGRVTSTSPRPRIQVPGFYDGVKPAAVGTAQPPGTSFQFDLKTGLLGRMGLRTPAGEKGRSSSWSGSGRGRPPTSPACGAAIPEKPGAKTVIPAEAHRQGLVPPSCRGRIRPPWSKGCASSCCRACRRRRRPDLRRRAVSGAWP